MQVHLGRFRPWVAAAALLAASATASAQDLTPSGRNGSTVPAGLRRVEIQRLDVATTIEGRVARTRVREIFRNTGTTVAEGDFLFPLPRGAAMDGLTLDLDGKDVPGELLDAATARRIYEDVVRSRKDPALLEAVGSRSFRARLFPIPPGETRTVTFSYSETLESDDGTLRWSFPLRLLARTGLPVREANVSFSVTADRTLASVWSPTHRVDVTRDGDRRAAATWTGREFRPEHDFVLAVQEPTDGVGFSFLPSALPDEPGAFLLAIAPAVPADAAPLPRDVVLCLDTSGSMAGRKLEQAREALRHGLATLGREDRFSMVLFATDVRRFRESLVPVTDETLEAARLWIDRIDAVGGTNLEAGVTRALALLGEGDADRPAVLLLLSDGLPTVGETNTDRLLQGFVAAAPKRVRAFPFGVGYDVDTVFLDGFAAGLRGAREYVTPEENIEVKVSSLVQKTRHTALTDLTLRVDGVEIADRYPLVLPDLFRGGELVVVGRYRGSGDATVTLEARGADGPVRFTRTLSFPKRTEGTEYVDRLWAMRRVGHLLDELRLHGSSSELVAEVDALARKHRIVTARTSLLVQEGDGSSDPRFLRGNGTNADIGLGGGAGGYFGGRRGGHRNLKAEGGGGTEGSVEAALHWLTRRQAADGFWATGRTIPSTDPATLQPPPPVGDTALALLAFLGYGETHKTPRFGACVRTGLRALRDSADGDGCFGPRDGADFPRDHVLGTLAMAEAYGLTQSPLFKGAATDAVRFLISVRRPDGLWGSGPEGDVRTSVWAVMALKSAMGAGLPVDAPLLADAAGKLQARLERLDTAGAAAPGDRAGVLLAHVLGDDLDRAAMDATADALVATPPEPGDAEGRCFATLAVFQLGGDRWKTWSADLRSTVQPLQVTDRADGENLGSWPGGDPADARERFRVTVFNTLDFQVYYRYARVFGSSRSVGRTGKDAVDLSRAAGALSGADSAEEGE